LAKYYNLSNKRTKKDYTIQQIMCETVLKSLLMHLGSPEAYTYRNPICTQNVDLTTCLITSI